jgi:Flp pilus assembly protein TadG
VALLEAAISSLLLFTMLFGILELGYMFRDYQITSDAASDGARMAAVLGPDGSADFEIMSTMREATGSMPPEWIERIVIFRGTGGTSSAENQITSACKNGTPVVGRCNVYEDVIEAFNAVEDANVAYFSCPGGEACSWPPSARGDGPTIADIDSVGVYLTLDREFLTGMFGQTMTIDEAAVARIEVGELTG